jgi:hypothetical protein
MYCILTLLQYPDTTTIAMIVAAFLLASWLGCCITASPWSDKMGRRFWILLGACTQIVGTIISVSSHSSGQLIAGRVVIVSAFHLHCKSSYLTTHEGHRKWTCSRDGANLCRRNYAFHQDSGTVGRRIDGICLHCYRLGVLDVRLTGLFR